MQKIIEELAAQVDASLAGVTSSESLAAFWQEYLSKNGKVPGLMKQLRTVPKEERPAAGKIINEFKGKVEAEYEAAAARIKAPSLHNWLALALAVRGEGISDFPICNKSFNLSYCGHDL